MKNIEVSYQQAWGAVNLIIRVEQPQLLEGFSINLIQQNNIDFLLPVTVSNMNNVTILMYKIAEQTENIRFMDTSITKQQATTMLLNMIGILINLKNWNLDYHRICMDTRCIYVNKMNGKVYYVYMPTSDYFVSDIEIKQTLYGVLQSLNIIDEPEIKGRLLGCFTENGTVSELYQRIVKVCNESIVQFASEEPSNPVFYLELISSEMPGVPRRINLAFQGNGITIGRTSQSEEQPDVAFPSDCKGIGRKHARIERQGNNYYLIDLNSVNHTFLNGQQLSPNQPYMLQIGCEVTFTKMRPVCYRMIKG